MIKVMARRIFLSTPAQAANGVVDRTRQRAALHHWERTGRVLPPPHIVKQWTVKAYADEFALDTLIETGTYLGAMIEATRNTFTSIHSIELDRALHWRAQRRFHRYDHIFLYNGDSSEVLPAILAGIREPCLFWLDAHHSGVLTARGALDSPIGQEVDHVLRHPVEGHVVLVDDAHLFTGHGGYPTLQQLREVVRALRPEWTFEVRYGIIRMHRARALGGR